MAVQALSSYEAAVGNLKGLVGDLLRISRDRDAYWQYRLDREANVRRMWEESMARVAKEQEELESRIGESELKRRKTKRALREALEGFEVNESRPLGMEGRDDVVVAEESLKTDGDDGVLLRPKPSSPMRRKSTLAGFANISESESDDDDEFFDAIGAGEIQVVEMPVTSPGLKGKELLKSSLKIG